MRIVQFTRSFHLGGTEGQVLTLLEGFRRRHSVEVAIVQDAGPLLDEVRALGHAPRRFPLDGSLLRLGTATQVARLALWLRRSRIDLLHAHDFYAAMLGVPAAKLAGCKVVLGRLDLAHWYGPLRRAALARLTRMADRVVANAEAIRRMLIEEEGAAPERVSVIHNGIDLARFDQRAEGPLDARLPDTRGEPVVTLVANFNPVKRQQDFLVALAYARQEGRRVQAFLVGDGVRRPEVEALATELGLNGIAHFLGHRRDVPALLRRASINVLCSSAEGLPNALIEGMAAGLPTIATAVGGNPELIEDGVRGLLVPPHQPMALSRALSALLDRPDLAQRMGRAARSHVEARLGADRLVDAHERLYRSALAA